MVGLDINVTSGLSQCWALVFLRSIKAMVGDGGDTSSVYGTSEYLNYRMNNSMIIKYSPLTRVSEGR
jgi:hypothetical protein